MQFIDWSRHDLFASVLAEDGFIMRKVFYFEWKKHFTEGNTVAEDKQTLITPQMLFHSFNVIETDFGSPVVHRDAEEIITGAAPDNLQFDDLVTYHTGKL